MWSHFVKLKKIINVCSQIFFYAVAMHVGAAKML